MCATMPSPDSVRGALNIDIKNNSVINLDNEFVNDAARKTFTENTLKRLNQEISVRSKQNQLQCASATALGRFYLTQDALVIGSPPTTHSNAACDAEVSLPKKEISSQLKPNSVLQP